MFRRQALVRSRRTRTRASSSSERTDLRSTAAEAARPCHSASHSRITITEESGPALTGTYASGETY